MAPLHPAVVHLPIALVVLSLIADLTGYASGSAALSATGFLSGAGAAVGAALALPSGLFDMGRQSMDHEAHTRVHVHMKVGFVLFAALAALAIWRWIIYKNSETGAGPGYLAVAALVVGLAAFQGWLGADLVFAYGVGVRRHHHGHQDPAHPSSPGEHGRQ